jgi:hypothetical protein
MPLSALRSGALQLGEELLGAAVDFVAYLRQRPGT